MDPLLSLLTQHPDNVNIKLAYFISYKDEYGFCSEEKKKMLRTAFMVFYMEELRDKLRELVVLNCPTCNQDIVGKEPYRNGPHTCSNFKSLRQAYREYGTSAMEAIRHNSKTRWLICQKWWNFVFDLPAYSSIRPKDAIKFSQEVDNDFFYFFLYGWEEEFNNMMDRFDWDKPNSDIVACILYELSK